MAYAASINYAFFFFGIQTVVIPQSGRTSFLKLGDRLMRSFCGNVSGTAGNPWTRMALFPGSTDVRVMVEHNTEGTVNKPRGTTVVFTTTVWLEVSPDRLFNFLRHGNSRNEVCYYNQE